MFSSSYLNKISFDDSQFIVDPSYDLSMADVSYDDAYHASHRMEFSADEADLVELFDLLDTF